MHTTPPAPPAPGPRFVNAYTARAPGTRRTSEPVIHASHHPPVPKGEGTYTALCGRTVRNVTTLVWVPSGPGRLCPECVNETVRRARPTAVE